MRKRLTVSRIHRPRAWRRGGSVRRPESFRPPPALPFIRLSGRWLRRYGFPVGSTIEVEASPGRLVLTAVASDSTREPASEVAEPTPEA